MTDPSRSISDPAGKIDLEGPLDPPSRIEARTGALFPGPALQAVASRLESYIADLPVTREDVDLLRQKFDSHEPVDYGSLAEAFAYRFFLTNYWKTAIVLDHAQPYVRSTIVDLGCGSGAAAIAALAWLHDREPRPLGLSVALVDRNRRQLELANDMLDQALAELGMTHVERWSVEADVGSGHRGWKRALLDADLVVASHLLTENTLDADAIIEQVACTLGERGQGLVIERPDDPVWGLTTHPSTTLRYPDDKLALNGFPGRRQHRELAARYVAVRSHRSVLPELVARYFQAWQNRSVEVLDQIFSVDATYLDQPFHEPIKGLDGIRHYWVQRVVPQCDPKPRVLQLAVEGPRAYVEWRADLTVDGRSKAVKGIMVVELSASGDRIGQLREYYASEARQATGDATGAR